jgi:[acyl-carrier-protein] S-malonyltransferase
MTETGKVAYVFPGQGAQTVGMGRDLYDSFPAARVVFEQADYVLNFPLSRLCFEGPEAELGLTVNTQPALVTVSFACLAAIRDIPSSGFPTPAFVAGHSLGEYTALAAADVIDFATAIYLARERGRLMHEAALSQPGGMVAIIGLDEALVTQVCNETDTRIANFNCPGQLVISGAKEDIARAAELAKAKGAARTIPLAVSGAFHTPLMRSAVAGLSQVIASLQFRRPSVPIVANVTAQPLVTAEQVKAELVAQLCNGVQWQHTIEFMLAHGVTTFVEIGPGKVLSGLTKRINKNANTLNLGDAASIEGLSLGKSS